MSGVVSKKLKFKGDKPKKKRRHHHEDDGDDDDELAAMAAGDPRGELQCSSWTVFLPVGLCLRPGWVFPEETLEISGPSFILLPSQPLTCLAVRRRASLSPGKS